MRNILSNIKLVINSFTRAERYFIQKHRLTFQPHQDLHAWKYESPDILDMEEEKNEAEMKLGKIVRDIPPLWFLKSPHPFDHGFHQEGAKCGAEISFLVNNSRTKHCTKKLFGQKLIFNIFATKKVSTFFGITHIDVASQERYILRFCVTVYRVRQLRVYYYRLIIINLLQYW